MPDIIHPTEFDSCIRCQGKPLAGSMVCHHCNGDGTEKGWSHPLIPSCPDCHGYGSQATGFVCATCSGHGTASGRAKRVVINASGLCPACGGQGAHELGPEVSGVHNGCQECDGHGTHHADLGEPRAKITWIEFTQAEHDALMAEKLTAREQQAAAQAATDLQAEQDVKDKAVLADPKATTDERVMALARLQRYV